MAGEYTDIGELLGGNVRSSSYGSTDSSTEDLERQLIERTDDDTFSEAVVNFARLISSAQEPSARWHSGALVLGGVTVSVNLLIKFALASSASKLLLSWFYQAVGDDRTEEEYNEIALELISFLSGIPSALVKFHGAMGLVEQIRQFINNRKIALYSGTDKLRVLLTLLLVLLTGFGTIAGSSKTTFYDVLERHVENQPNSWVTYSVNAVGLLPLAYLKAVLSFASYTKYVLANTGYYLEYAVMRCQQHYNSEQREQLAHWFGAIAALIVQADNKELADDLLITAQGLATTPDKETSHFIGALSKLTKEVFPATAAHEDEVKVSGTNWGCWKNYIMPAAASTVIVGGCIVDWFYGSRSAENYYDNEDQPFFGQFAAGVHASIYANIFYDAFSAYMRSPNWLTNLPDTASRWRQGLTGAFNILLPTAASVTSLAIVENYADDNPILHTANFSAFFMMYLMSTQRFTWSSIRDGYDSHMSIKIQRAAKLFADMSQRIYVLPDEIVERWYGIYRASLSQNVDYNIV